MAKLDPEGNEDGVTYMGVDCAARMSRVTQKVIKDAARAANKAAREAKMAADRAADEQDRREYMAWVADTYGVHASQPSDLWDRIPGMTPPKLRAEYVRQRETA